MKFSMFARSLVLGLTFVAGTSLVLAPATAIAADDDKKSDSKTLTIGDVAPAIKVEKYLKGDPISEFKKGHVYVVEFWATWCGPCLHEMPELSALHAMRSNVEVVGLAYEDIELDEMQAFLKEHPVAYPIAIIDTYNPPKDFATPRGLPMTYLITPEGKVARKYAGPVTARMLEEGIAEAGGPAQA